LGCFWLACTLVLCSRVISGFANRRYKPKTRSKASGHPDPKSIGRDLSYGLFGWGSRKGFAWCVRAGAIEKAHDENGVVVATEYNDKPTLPSFCFPLCLCHAWRVGRRLKPTLLKNAAHLMARSRQVHLPGTACRAPTETWRRRRALAKHHRYRAKLRVRVAWSRLPSLRGVSFLSW
jgi:hypothetical protein